MTPFKKCLVIFYTFNYRNTAKSIFVLCKLKLSFFGKCHAKSYENTQRKCFNMFCLRKFEHIFSSIAKKGKKNNDNI